MPFEACSVAVCLDDYLARIGLSERLPADPDGLSALVAAHRRAIPFENLDIPLGRGIAIDSGAAFAKLVTARRGGYCFEQNRLFADMLGALGFAVRPLLARVRLGMADDVTPPRTHTLLLVTVNGTEWIADAGFGGSFVPPLRLADGAGARTGDGAEHRLVRRAGIGSRTGQWQLAGQWQLERRGSAGSTDGRGGAGDDWSAQYSFDLAEVVPDDLEQANHWTSTRPGTRFTALLVCSIVLPDGFVALSGRQLSVSRGDAVVRETLLSAAAMQAALAERFGIVVSADEAETLFAFTGNG